MLEYLALTGKYLGNTYVMCTIIIVGFVLYDSKVFGRAGCLLLFTVIYNSWLKSLWQIPLPPHLDGWAFPSGHMHAACVFWGALAIELNKRIFYWIYPAIISIVGYGLFYNGYHDLIDILGALGFACLSLIIYKIIINTKLIDSKPFLLGITLSAIGLILIALLPEKVKYKNYIWQTHGALIGLSMGWIVLTMKQLPAFSINQSITTLVVTLVGVVGIGYAFNQDFHLVDPHTMQFYRLFIIGMWIGCSKVIVNKLTANLGRRNTRSN